MCLNASLHKMRKPGKVANPVRGQLNREKEYCPRSRPRIWSRETRSAVLSRVGLLILHTQAEYVVYSRDYSRSPRRRPLFKRYTSSGQSRVYRVKQWCTDRVHCRESAGTGPVVLMVVPVTDPAFAGHHGPINVRLSFPTPIIGIK